jgi:hypothetical protein
MTNRPLAFLNFLLWNDYKVVRNILAIIKALKILLVVQIHLGQQNIDNVDTQGQL